MPDRNDILIKFIEIYDRWFICRYNPKDEEDFWEIWLTKYECWGTSACSFDSEFAAHGFASEEEATKEAESIYDLKSS